MSLWVICNQSGFEKLQIRCVINYLVGGTIKYCLIHNSGTAPIHHTTFTPIVDKNIIPGQFLHKIHPYFPLFKQGSVLTTDQHGTFIPIKMFIQSICHPSLHNLHGPACPAAHGCQRAPGREGTKARTPRPFPWLRRPSGKVPTLGLCCVHPHWLLSANAGTC
jgi:hypothetical protein